jgi:cell division protein FtsB
MASRSGGTTGVLVALVVFVVLSVALLAVSIVLYAGKSAAETEKSNLKAEFDRFINSEERDRSETKALMATGGGSLFGTLAEQRAQVAQFVTGDPAADLAQMRAALSLGEKDTIKDAMRKLQQDRDARSQEANSLKTKSKDLDKEIDGLKEQLAAAEKAREEAVASVTDTIASYSQAAEGYRGEFDAAKAALEQSRADLEARFSSEASTLQSEIDTLRAEREVLDGRIESLQRKVGSTSTKAANPAALVDSNVVDLDAKSGSIFIDIGANKRVVPGMTFEVFDDAAGIVAAAESGSRGKASVQVIKVGEATSTCRVLRGSGNRPIVKGDVLANAVFNPEYKYKFLVHGKFDVNGDGKPTTGEADYVKARIGEWGGEAVEGDTLTGDLDFLVLGAQPPFPAPLPSDATEAQTLAYTEQRNARELYDQLFRTASDAQIPILNWARFEALTGTVNR